MNEHIHWPPETDNVTFCRGKKTRNKHLFNNAPPTTTQHTHTHTHARTHARTHTHTHTRTHRLAHAQTRARTHTYTHARVHTHTHTHTHTLFCFSFSQLFYWLYQRRWLVTFAARRDRYTAIGLGSQLLRRRVGRMRGCTDVAWRVKGKTELSAVTASAARSLQSC